MSSGLTLEALDVAFRRARELDAPLSERLQVIADAVRTHAPSFAEAVDTFVSRLQESSAGATAPEVGETMPSFVLPDETGRLVELDELLKKGPVAVAFHRGQWCPYCRLNTVALAEVQEEVKAAGGQVVAITPDRQKFTTALKSESNAPFPILTDIDNGYAMSLELAIWVDKEMAKLIEGGGMNVSDHQGNDTWVLPIPATFVVGTDGRITARYIDPDYRKRMEIEDLLRALSSTR